MKKILLASLLFSSTISILFAQPKGMGKSDPEAKVILDAVSMKFKTFKSVQAKFAIKTENASGSSLGSKVGNVYMKGSKYRISIQGQEIFCDGSSVSTYDKSTNEVTITKVDLTANTLTPQKLFTNFYDKDFLYKLNGDKSVNGKSTKEIELTPIDKSRPFFKVLLYIDKSSSTIISTKLFEKTGNKYTYNVSNMNTTLTIADNQFNFDSKKFPGVEVVDLR